MKIEKARIVRFHQFGDASVLKIENLPVADPAENEVRIKVEAIGLNRAEVMFRNGAYLEAPQLPSRLGYEASGVVEAVGAGVKDLKVGDKVSTIPAFSIGTHGVYGEYALVPAHAVAKYPESLTPLEATSIWMQYITAYGALIYYGKLQPGQNVLITAASSSVGVASIHLAKETGATVIAVTRSKSKKQFLLDQGADFAIATHEEDLVAKVQEYTQNMGVNLVFDPIGGPIINQLAEASAPGAQIIEYGALSSEPSPYPLFQALAKGIIIRGYTLFEITTDPQKLQVAKDYLLPLFAAKKLVPVIDKEFKLEAIQEAHKYMESNQQKGKIVVTV